MMAAERSFSFAAIIDRDIWRLHRETDPRTALTGKMDTGSPLGGH
jgi:hypothetical protein